MIARGVTIRGLEVFEALAATGSVAEAAETTGLSQPAVSQQIRNLETALNRDLLDHGKRPMRLTPAGRAYLSHTSSVLSQLRLAHSELSVMDLSHLDKLSMGIIDDFDNELTPRLVTKLAEAMSQCQFRLITSPSHEILRDLQDHVLHLGVAASSGEAISGITEYPLACDPFILITPSEFADDTAPRLAKLRELPMLRYERGQLIARQIDAHMKQINITFPNRFEIGSNPTLISMVSRGLGWAVTTPLSYFCVARAHTKVTAHPLPFTPFSRNISLFANNDWADTVPRDVAQTVRNLVQQKMILPAIDRFPWLDGKFRVLSD
ncbi:LysR family transcriptional regulator [Pseudopelagicola sp. nBUS_19]|uniref:LysR family transcriptional regulator n=1 Tax=Pseudopelagicola sp. nBUS_19 TaxID=3395316 RepID=UPI003EBFC000